MSRATNAERVANYITSHGSGGLLVHSVPGTPFWLVAEATSPETWRITLCHPQHTKAYLVAENISDDDHYELWNQLIRLELGKRITSAVQKLKKGLEHFLRNRVNTGQLSHITSSAKRRDKNLNLAVKEIRNALFELTSPQ